MRLDKFLANENIGSRKEVGVLVRSGAVTVNGQAVKKALDGLIKSIDFIMQYEEEELRQAGATKEKLPAQRDFIIQHYEEMINQTGK